MTPEGYPTGELKHGPNALVSEQVPLVALATVDRKVDDSSVALREDPAAARGHEEAGRPSDRESRMQDDQEVAALARTASWWSPRANICCPSRR